MKTNKKVLIGLVLLVVLFIYFLPLLMEFQKIDISIFGICIGTGCHPYSASSTSGIGGIDCRGYQFLGVFCFSDPGKYCMYANPFESREKCKCETVSAYYRGAYRKFCKKNTICYTNSWEYEFGCAEDMEKTCKEVENRLRTEKSCPYCETSWVERYSTLRESEKKIVGKQFKSLCTLICKNCDTTLCTKDNLCEYAVHSSNTII